MMKRNKKIERTIRKRFNAQDMDVSFENQRCCIPFILVKMTELEGQNSVEHDGRRHIQLHSSTPIECIGDAQVLNQIYPVEKSELNEKGEAVRTTADLTRDFQKMRPYMPFSEFQRIHKLLKKANRKYNDVMQNVQETSN